MAGVHGTGDTLYYIYRCRRGRGLRYCLFLAERQCESLNGGISKDRIPALFLYVPTKQDDKTTASGSLPHKKKDGIAMGDIHFGHMILNELRRQRYSIAWFAKEMGSDRSNMYKLLARPHLNTDFVLRASRLLHHDFFGEASSVFLENNEN